MLIDEFEYPTRGEPLETTIIGGLLMIASLLVLPAVYLFGYYIDIFRTTQQGKEEPPEFTTDDIGERLKDGLAAIVISSVHSMIVIAPLLGIYLGVFGVPSTETESSLSGFIIAGIVVVFITTLYLSVVTPASYGLYAKTGSIFESLSPLNIIDLMVNKLYVITLVLSFMIGIGMLMITVMLGLIPFIGGLISVFVQFPIVILVQRLFAVAVSEQLSNTIEPSTA